MEPVQHNKQEGSPSRDALVKDLALMLLYLTSWRERKQWSTAFLIGSP